MTRPLLLLLKGALVALLACSLDSPEGTSVTVQSVEGRPRSAELLLIINSCNRNPRTIVEESADSIRIAIAADEAKNGNECPDGIRVTLTAPLGDREVFDVARRSVGVDLISLN